MDKRGMIGQKLVTGLPGNKITEEFRQLVREYKVGNVILFERNIESAQQLRQLCDELQTLIQAETGLPAFITIDQEGGMISRLCDPGAVIPGAMALAATADLPCAYGAGLLCGKTLLRCGVNFNLSPVMDVNSNPQNPIIGARSYGDTPDGAAAFGCEMVRGLQDAGVYACLKHFPGHGDTDVDSHLGLPCINKSREELEKCEFIPFQAGIRAGVKGVMTTHILFPQIEKGGVPATMSRVILQDILRSEMGFEGLILSDCMMMQAIADHYGTVAGACAAAKAGVDLIFICHDNALTGQACALMDRELTEDELIASYRRIENAKNALRMAPPELDFSGNLSMLQELHERSVTLVGGPTGTLPPLGSNPLFIGCRSVNQTQVSNQGENFRSFPEILKAALGGEALDMTNDPEDSACALAASRLTGHTAVVLTTFNAHLHSRQQKLIRSVVDASPVPVILVAMRNPYDLRGWSQRAYCLAAYDFTPPAMQAVCRVLSQAIPPRGKLPIRL